MPFTPARWDDFVQLFGPRGACAGCWCMFWRRTRAEWIGSGEPNKRAMKRIVASGEVPGLLAYAGREPIGWVSLGPRTVFPRLERSRTLKPVDDRPSWSVVCFFVARAYRKKGLTRTLLEAAAAFAKKRGATLLEGYPIDPDKRYPDTFAYTGLAPAFRKTGFRQVGQPGKGKRTYRREL